VKREAELGILVIQVSIEGRRGRGGRGRRGRSSGGAPQGRIT